MSETAIVTDESLEETPHNAPLSANEESGSVDKSGQESEDRPEDPRLAIMEKMASMNNEERAIDPGTRQEEMPAGEPVPEFDAEDDEIETGLSHQESFGDDGEDPDEGLPEEYADDPLAEFIEMEGDEPMFRTVVNGQQQLIPLEKARADLQKGMAADQRLREVAQFKQNLDDREAAINAREAQLQQKLQGMHDAAAPPQGEEPQSEEALTAEARSVVKELFTGSEEDAAAKLADLLLKNRGAAQVSTSVNPAEIAHAAVAYAKQELSAEARTKDVQKGYKKFTQDYPEIAADDNLFAFADGLTSKIEAEHPDWMPSEVMLEAGKRTREWVESQKSDEKTSEQDPAQNDRTERKRKLRRVPRARQGAEPKEETPEETPTSIIAEMRAARGLPD